MNVAKLLILQAVFPVVWAYKRAEQRLEENDDD